MRRYSILQVYDIYTLYSVNPYHYQIVRSELDHKEGNEFSVVLFHYLSIVLSNSYELTLFWPAIEGKSSAFKISCHKKCYWRDFDVAAGSQAFNIITAPLLGTYVKSTSTAGKLAWIKCGIKDKANKIKPANSVYILLILIDWHGITYKLID